jgi:hypothetical protein
MTQAMSGGWREQWVKARAPDGAEHCHTSCSFSFSTFVFYFLESCYQRLTFG